jgi:hypothetical protein
VLGPLADRFPAEVARGGSDPLDDALALAKEAIRAAG